MKIKEIGNEYGEDYRISPFIRKFNADDCLRPKHMIVTVFKTNNDALERNFINASITEDNIQTLSN